MVDNAPNPRICRTSDGSQTVYSERFAQTYHSKHGAERETNHIFLDANGLREQIGERSHLRVLEIGYGTGLNVLALASALKGTSTTASVHSLEIERLPSELLRQLKFEELATVDARVHQSWMEFEESGATCGRLGAVELTLHLGDATTLNWMSDDPFDFVWHDAFSPDANPALWTTAFLAAVFRSMQPEAVLSTFTVKGTVRRALMEVGFDVEKVPGPQEGKREVLVARKPAV